MIIGSVAGLSALPACSKGGTREMTSAVLEVMPLGFPWLTIDPFLFCVHHDDAYPAGNAELGPAASLEGRMIGQDFEGRDGWRMYHGERVPGFPQHPHRGFETVTVVRRGFIDHSDSVGATARYGAGDTQWLTAGAGIMHAEMFPLLEQGASNPLELFQIWLNLPRADKFAAPHFSMLWREHTPVHTARDAAGKRTTVTVVAGKLALGETTLVPPAPPPKSWAATSEHDVAIWTLSMEGGARFKLPAAHVGTNRMLYFYRGDSLSIGDRAIPLSHAAQLRGDVAVELASGAMGAELLLLQGRPIGEPVVAHGPFVMTTREEIQQAYADYQRSRFGGWPWPSIDPTHPRDAGRFAIHADGRKERAG
jgi:redox-sensitive bicupin YhaK (pirin superfamily)